MFLIWILGNPIFQRIYRAIKSVRRFLCGTTELLRICSSPYSPEICANVEVCIRYSKQLALERYSLESKNCGLTEVGRMIAAKKLFVADLHEKTLFRCLETINLCSLVQERLEATANTKYDDTLKEHKDMLKQLWTLMFPEKTVIVSDEWITIGFQSKNPGTDFRGMGILGLKQLIYIVQMHPGLVQDLMEACSNEVSWYSYAIVGINITAFLMESMRSRKLNYYFYVNHCMESDFHELYCFVFWKFNKHWTSYNKLPPLTIMDFNREFGIVKAQVEHDLALRKKLTYVSAASAKEEDFKHHFD